MDKEQFTKIIFNTLGYEGGVDMNSINGSGISNAGITQRTYDSYAKQKKIDTKDVRDLNAKEVRDFYYNDLYKRPKINNLPDEIQGVVFDYAVQSGDDRAVKSLQRAVGAKDDGLIGPKTIKKVNDYIKKNGAGALNSQIIDEREEFLLDLTVNDPQHAPFADGYINRMNNLRGAYITE